MRAGIGAGTRGGDGGDIFHAAIDGVVLVDAGIEQRGHPRGGARPGGDAGGFLVSEAAVGVLALANIVHGLVDGFLGHLDAGVAGRAQGHDLADGDGNIGVVGDGVVAPAALVVLGTLDERAGLDERFMDASGERSLAAAGGHAVHLAEEERGEAVAVHGAVGGIRGEQAGLGGR